MRLPYAVTTALERFARWAIRDREPDMVLVRDGEVYLERWFLWPRTRRRAEDDGHESPRFAVFVHQIHGPDPANVHCHPWDNASIVLSGQYLEHHHDRTSDTWSAGDVGFRTARELHRLEPTGTAYWVLGDPVLTLFLHGRRKRTWGFLQPGHRWMSIEETRRENPEWVTEVRRR